MGLRVVEMGILAGLLVLRLSSEENVVERVGVKAEGVRQKLRCIGK